MDMLGLTEPRTVSHEISCARNCCAVHIV